MFEGLDTRLVEFEDWKAKGQGLMKQSNIYRKNAENCMQMAEAAEAEPAYNRFKRMEAAWLALAEEQDWLDGEQSPVGPDDGLKARK